MQIVKISTVEVEQVDPPHFSSVGPCMTLGTLPRYIQCYHR